MKTVSLLATNKAPAIKCNDFFQSIVKAAVPCSQCAFCQKNFCCKSNSVQRLKAAPTECWGRGLSPTRPALEEELVVLRLLDPVTMSPDSASQP